MKIVTYFALVSFLLNVSITCQGMENQEPGKGFFGSIVNSLKECPTPSLTTLYFATCMAGGISYIYLSIVNEDFLIAAYENNLENMKIARRRGALINCTTSIRYNALQELARANITPNLAIVDYLLSRGINLENKSDDGRTALHIASARGHEQLVDKLITVGADINSLTRHKNSSLHIAASEAHTPICTKLIQNGVDIFAINKDDHNCLYYACKSANIDQRLETIRALLYTPTFDPQPRALSSSQPRIKELLRICKQYTLPKEAKLAILAHLPEDILSQEHCRILLNIGQDITTLVPYCPLAWFKEIYKATDSTHQEALLNQMVLAIADYRFNKIKALILHESVQGLDKNELDSNVAALIDPLTIEQHRIHIQEIVRNEFESH